MTTATSFTIIPWENDFLQGLARLVLHETGNDAARACIIMPHSRPRRYLARTMFNLPDLPKPFALPQVLTVNELFRTMRAETETAPPEQIALLDRVGLLLRCLDDLGQTGGQQEGHPGDGPGRALPIPTDDMNRFFPWGVRLANLLEDFYTQNLDPSDVQYMEGQVVDFAADILGDLGRIHALYTQRLDEHGWTTPGYDAYRVIRNLQQDASAFQHVSCLRDRMVFIAGFYGLNGVEDALFRHLHQQHGAHVILHSDARLADSGTSCHWACREHDKWMRRWHVGAVCAEDTVPREQTLSFHEGFDLHSQLDVLERSLSPDSGTDLHGTAVVLPDTGLLMPVLHHLPRKDVNISMGYPLERSTLFRLLETAMRLQETAAPGGYYWKELISLVRHPYLKMLGPETEQPLAGPLRNMETAIRSGKRYSDPRTLHPDMGRQSAMPEPEVRALLARILDATVTRWEHLATTRDLADTLADLCALLLEHGGTLWERFPIDAESMFRLMRRVIPQLREASLAAQSFPRDVLFTILRETIRQERVPFEADPLTGLQVLGMLETRLLHFHTVHIVDATEDRLPGPPPHDPLLPDSLRGLLRLPDGRHREQVAAYNFHRLIRGASTVAIHYQSGVQGSGLFEEKKSRSRFVEELLWQEEQRLKTLLKPGMAPLHAVSYPMPAICTGDRPVMRSAAVDSRIHEYLKRPLSPSALDAYLTCPVRFFHERICGLSAVDEVNEGDDFAGIGDLLHAVLEEFFKPYTGRTIRPDEDDARRLQELFVLRLQQSELRDQLPFDSYLMLEAAGVQRLAQFLEQQPETRIVALEKDIAADVDADDLPPGAVRQQLAGRIDRIDEREDGIVILDYKTGSVNRPHPRIWDNTDLWQQMRAWNGEDDDTLHQLAEAIHSVQLPAYLYMYAHGGTGTKAPRGAAGLADAGWVELKTKGQEILLFGKDTSDDDRTIFLEDHIPLLMRFLFRHMRTSPAFRPRRGKHCEWCSCANCCSM